MEFKEENGVLMTSDADNARLIADFFEKLFNHDADVDWNHVNGTKQRLIIVELGYPICFQEFYHDINKLTWHKTSGINVVSPNVIKSLDFNNKLALFEFSKVQKED